MGEKDNNYAQSIKEAEEKQEKFTKDITETEYVDMLVAALWEERIEDANQYAKDTMLAMIAEEEAQKKAEMEAKSKQPAFVDPNKQPQITEGQSPEEKQEETNQRIQEAQDEILADISTQREEHLVRGAMMHCQCGSHYRRLNLPFSHGHKENGRPLMNAKDSLAGEKLNIPTFGVCSSSHNETGGSILLKKDYPRDIYGKKISDTVEGNIRGTPCVPIIESQWLNPQEGTQIDGAPAITPSSFLVCQYGGIIEVVDSGQHDEETAIEGEE